MSSALLASRTNRVGTRIGFSRSGRFGLTGVLIAFVLACGSESGYRDLRSNDWIAALETGTTGERVRAAEALGSILRVRPSYPKVVKALSFAVQDTSDAVRLAAASALSADGVDKFAAVSGLHAMFHDTAHPDVRASVAQLVARLGAERARPLLPSMREALDDSNPKVRAAAVESIAILGSANSGDALLVARLAEDSAPAVRKAAFMALAALRPPASMLLPLARHGLNDSAPPVKSSAALALCSLGRDALPALDDLIVHLEDRDGTTVQSVIFAISSIGPDAKRALPALDSLERDNSGEVREAVKTALSVIRDRSKRGSARPSAPSSACPE